jgi:hypothetical protein
MRKTILAVLLLFSTASTPWPAAASASPASKTDPSNTDPLSAMFTWFNDAYATPGAYTPEAFRKFVTDDISMTINGETVVQGIDDWAAHFAKIQSSGAILSVGLPLRRVKRIGDTIYTYNIMRASHGAVDECMISAGYATIKSEKIASLVLIRVPADPQKEADCKRK